MPTSSSPASARWAILVIFLLHGVLLGAWVTQIPLAKARLETGLGLFGIALLSFAAGAVLAMPLAGVAINRFGSARLTWIMGLSFCVCLFGPSFVPSLPLFMLSGLALGASVGSMDVAMNAHGLAVEKALRKPVMSGLHGGFSVGAAVGTIGGAMLLRAVGPELQLPLIAAFCAVGIL
ncbi:MAG: MFS transporter, partial [Phyllobacteriaceae bacterium]|nr:MFS transporter [Phyllobacteriaceae bacterium]